MNDRASDGQQPTAGASSPKSPLIFISHDTRDAQLAEAFSKLLSSVSAGVLKSFRSSDQKGSQGIEYGVEWYPELMKKLDAASDVVCLLTERSLDRPWILYEAGVAKGKLGTPVSGVALGIPLTRANSGPFAQFQNLEDTVESITKLVAQLVRRIPGADPDTDAVKMQVETFKKTVDPVLKKLGGKAASDTESKDVVGGEAVARLFEEVKVMFQDLPSRIERRLDSPQDNRRRRRLRHLHPMMFEEIMHMGGPEASPGFNLLFLAGLLRDDAPWFYEPIMELYRAIEARDQARVQTVLAGLRRMRSLAERGPFMEMFAPDDPDGHRLIFEMPMIIEHMCSRMIGERPRRHREPRSEKP
jgi:hypothetical protein